MALEAQKLLFFGYESRTGSLGLLLGTSAAWEYSNFEAAQLRHFTDIYGPEIASHGQISLETPGPSIVLSNFYA
jgi:hypothetical protein